MLSHEPDLDTKVDGFRNNVTNEAHENSLLPFIQARTRCVRTSKSTISGRIGKQTSLHMWASIGLVPMSRENKGSLRVSYNNQ